MNWFLQGLVSGSEYKTHSERGVALIAVAAALIAAGAAAVFSLRVLDQADRLDELIASNSNIDVAYEAVLAYAVANERLPCPADGTAGTGIQTFSDGTPGSIDTDDTDDTCTIDHGIIPWAMDDGDDTDGLREGLDLGVERAQSSSGTMFSYVLSEGASQGLDYCTRVGGEATGGTETGQITVMQFDGSNVVTASTSPVIAAIIDHGANGLGGFTATGESTGNPISALERYNCAANQTNCTDPGTGDTQILSGPLERSDNDNFFDDVVRLITADDFADFCEQFIPNGGVNNLLSDDFSDGVDTTNTYNALASGNFAGSVTGETSSASGNSGDGIAQFTVTGSAAVALATQANFETTAVPIYVSVEYRPESIGTAQVDFSVVTRADTSTGLAAPDENVFTDGITFQFSRAASGSTITPSIRTSGSTIATSGDTVPFTDNRAYLIEVYDNGQTAWARITDTQNTTDTAVVFAPDNTLTEDVAPPNSVVLVLNTTNGAGVDAEIDDLLVARGIGAYSPDGSNDSIRNTNTSQLNALQSAISGSNAFTLEAWIKPSGTSSNQTLISKWEDGGAVANQAFQFGLTSGGNFQLQLSDGSANTETFSTSSGVSGNTWNHVAVSVDATGANPVVQFYLNGAIRGSAITASTLTGIGVSTSSTPFVVASGVDGSGIPANSFGGEMSEVRVWSTTRSSSEISSNYTTRLSGSPTGLIAHWELNADDITTTGDQSTAGIAFNGDEANEALGPTFQGELYNGTTLGGRSWAGSQNTLFFLPFSVVMCGNNATGFFECSYSTATDTTAINFPDDIFNTTIPGSIENLRIAAWGAGGGGYPGSGQPDRNGGGGGYSAITLINVDGQELLVTVGGGGSAGGSGDGDGAGGGGKSEVEVVDGANPDSAVIAGGGGGAGYSDDASINGYNCADTRSSSPNPELCGDGGAGGGGTSPAAGQDAFDDALVTCGGTAASDTSGGAGGQDATSCSSSPASADGNNATGTPGGIGDGGEGVGTGTAAGGGSGDADDEGEGGNGGVSVGDISGGGGGGGYAGGGAGNEVGGSDTGSFGGAGGSGFVATSSIGPSNAVNVAAGAGSAGNGFEAGNSTDPDRPSSAGQGGQGNSAGTAGAVVIRW